MLLHVGCEARTLKIYPQPINCLGKVDVAGDVDCPICHFWAFVLLVVVKLSA